MNTKQANTDANIEQQNDTNDNTQQKEKHFSSLLILILAVVCLTFFSVGYTMITPSHNINNQNSNIQETTAFSNIVKDNTYQYQYQYAINVSFLDGADKNEINEFITTFEADNINIQYIDTGLFVLEYAKDKSIEEVKNIAAKITTNLNIVKSVEILEWNDELKDFQVIERGL